MFECLDICGAFHDGRERRETRGECGTRGNETNGNERLGGDAELAAAYANVRVS